MDLHGQLSGGEQDEATRGCRSALELHDGAIGVTEVVGDAHQHRETESECLARTGLGLAADVPACQRIGDGHGLDGEGSLDAILGQGGTEIGADAERRERRVRRIGVVLR